MEKSPKNIIWIDEDTEAASKHDVGGKAAALYELNSFGVNIPTCFFVTTYCHKEHISSIGLKAVYSDYRGELLSEDITVRSAVAKKIRDIILEGDIGEAALKDILSAVKSFGPEQQFAVRSSAVVEDGKVQSWAGQFDSYLNINSDEIEHYVKRCWASQFNSRAVAYNPEAYSSFDALSFGVIVQVMVDCDVSGVTFTQDPASLSEEKVYIEAVAGTGETLVSGKEIPFSALLGKEDGVLLKRSLGNRNQGELLSPSQLKSIANECTHIELVKGCPVDIEWGIKGGALYILQSRAITPRFRSASPDKVTDMPDHLGYELTFKVTGLGYLFSDMLIRGFGYLEPLLTSTESEFRQYFLDERMEFAAREGHRWLSKKEGFIKYQREFEEFHDTQSKILESIMSRQIDDSLIETFFGIQQQYFEHYSKTDFQFTNLTYLYSDENDIIRKNLALLAEFKDKARIWINRLAIDEDSFFVRFVQKLSNATGISEDDIQNYKIDELIELTTSGANVPSSELQSRRTAFVIFVDKQKQIQYRSGEEASLYIDSISEQEDYLVSTEVAGQVANCTAENVTGMVCKINVDYADTDNMEQAMDLMRSGQVLVSEFTAPELMSACKKSAAIVTDLGGMLSHAAIVSRELGVSCLVGTRVATRTFESGDGIRIDFVRGVASKDNEDE